MDFLISHASRGFVYLVALAFVGFGALGWIDPVRSAASLELDITSGAGRTEVRATYGGLLVGIGILLAYLASSASGLRHGVVAVVVLLLGLGLTRLFGILADGGGARLQLQFLALELGPAALGLVLLAFDPALRRA